MNNILKFADEYGRVKCEKYIKLISDIPENNMNYIAFVYAIMFSENDRNTDEISTVFIDIFNRVIYEFTNTKVLFYDGLQTHTEVDDSIMRYVMLQCFMLKNIN